MADDWRAQRERSNAVMVRLLFGIGLRFGRPLARLILWPTVAYFLLTGGAARRASRRFLAVALGRPARLADVARHFFCFAATVLDRVFLYAGRTDLFELDIHGADAFDALVREGRGALLMVAHLGSFDALRIAAARRDDDLRVKVLMDMQHGRVLNRALAAVNADLMEHVIDTAQGDVDLILRVREALDQGVMVGVMADRLARAGERELSVDFLGRPMRVPASPWLLASVLRVPVVLCVGTYAGGNRYALSFDVLDAAPGRVARGQRQQQVQALAQRFADRLGEHARSAPYNWFNFYDVWAASADVPDRAAATTS